MRRSIWERIQEIINKHVIHGKWVRSVIALSCVVIFITTYVLVMPAVTLSGTPDCGQEEHRHTDDCYETQSEQICGLEEHTHSDDCYDEDGNLICGLEEHVHNDGCYETEEVLTCGMEEHIHTADCYKGTDAEGADQEDGSSSSEDAGETESKTEQGEDVTDEVNSGDAESVDAPEAAEAADPEGPAESEEPVSGNLLAEGEDYTITVSYTEEANLPADVSLKVEEITNKEEYDSYKSQVEEEILDPESKKVTAARFFDITLLDSEGNELHPEKAVTVVIETKDTLNENEELQVCHFDQEQEKPVKVKSQEIINETYKEDNLGVQFEAESFSVYGIVGTESITVPFTTGDGRTYEVTVDFDKDAGIPEGAQLKVSEVTEDNSKYDDYVEQATDAIDSRAEALNYIKLLNIEIVDENGDKVDLEAPVDVTIKLLDKEQNEEEQTQVVHFEGANEMPVVLDSSAEADTVSFSADGFSVYAIVYTVDFEYSVNGKMYQFSLPGGGFVSFTDLVEVLGIIGDTNSEENGDENGAVITENGEENGINEGAEEDGIDSDTNTALTLGDVEVSEATRKFVANVANVEFSSPELVDVSKVENETTVGQIKESRGLEVEYSALTVTMKTGEVFQITVTDDQENPYGLDGKAFAITAYKNSNSTYYFISSDGTGISSSNNNCLKADNFNPSSGGTPQGSSWTFEWTGEGKKYLIHDNQNRYIVIENDRVILTDKDTALDNPITVVSREGKYSFVNEKNNHALNIFGNSGFGSWTYSEGNSDFLMTLQNPSNMKTPGTIATADTSGLLQINLFDYGPEDQLDKEANNNSNPYSGGINSGHTLKFFSYGKNVGNGVNDFTGAGNGPQTGIVADQLSGNYPVLASNTNESLAYLFGGESNNYVTSYTGLNHLFTKDENGYYHYNSDQNYAYLDGSNFKVYSKTFPEEGADEQYFGVGFFPFNDYDEYYNCIHGKDGFERWDPHRNGTNPKKNGHYNHHFGMSLKGNFIMPPGGQYNGKDVTFQFSGDDDMWVYVDGVLIMDIGGVHNPVHGEINFTTGEVTVHGAAQENFKEKYKRITGKDWDDSDFSNHDFRVFYMERGGMYSNLEVTFNLPLTPETETNNFQFDKISSENESLKLSGAEFSLFNDPACGDPFTLASVPVKATSDKNGVVSFKNIPHGTYYMKETGYPEGYQAKTPEEIFTVVVDASGGTITSSSGDSISQVTNKPKKIDVEVEKVWSNGIVPSGAEIEIVLGRYKLVEDPNAPGTATLVIKDSYTGLPSGSNYHVTYTITGPDGYSNTITKSYTDSSKQIEESVEVPAIVAGSQYTVTKQVQNISYHNINNQNQTVNVTVAKNGTGQTQFNQSTFARSAYSITIYSIDKNGNQTTVSRWVDPTYYSSGSSVYLRCYYKTENSSNGGYARDRRFQYSFDNNSFTDFTLENQGQTNQTGRTAAFTVDHDISIYIRCKDNLNWSNGYDWFVNPTIVDANPVQAASADRMMMSMRRGAPAQSMSQTASDPTLPEPPQNTLYVLDEDYAANPDKITLSGGTWTGKAEELDAYNEYGPYVYYIASVNESGMPEGTQITISNEVTMDGAAQVLTVTNTVPTGYLRIDKSVTFNGISPVPDDKKAALAGMYEFKVYTDENCSIPYKVKNGETESDLTLTVTIGNDGAAQSSGTVQLPVGDYWIEEQNPSQTGVTPDANRIHVVVTESSTASSPATAEFVNNKDESNDPDEQAIELEKKFSGITDASQIPSDFHVTLSYKVPGSDTPVTITLNSSTEGHVTCTKSNNDLTWHWRITHIPVNATDFSVSESNYDIDGYTRVTKINGTTVEDPSSPEGIVVLQPEISMVNFWSNYTTSDKRKIFPVTGNQILLVRSTTGVTVVVSQKSLSMATRNAIEDLITNNGGKIPGDPDANATWKTTFVYFSHEIQGDRFSYGGRTIFFNGNNVEVPHNASSHEVRVDINYISETVQNSFVLENNYTEIPITIDIEKVEKDDTSVKLPGAVFTLRKIKDADPINGTYATEDGTSPRDSEPTAATTGMTSFDNLTNGYYELTEKTAPAGYVLTDEMATYFKVESGVVTWLVKGDGKPSTWTTKSGKGSGELVDFEAAVAEDTEQGTAAKNAKFVIENEPGAALPSTGGPGTSLICLLGIMLTGLAGAGMVMQLRRKAS